MATVIFCNTIMNSDPDHPDPTSSVERRKSYTAVTLFTGKVKLLQLRRSLQNTFQIPGKRYPAAETLGTAPILGVSETELWYNDSTETERLLTLGKIENLRVALRAIDGIEIPAGKEFSFWRQIGNPTRSKGFTVGREIQEGCMVPTVAGGLCQLSNALYDAALKAGLTIVERHRHSQVVSGSLAEQGRDATVKWNYLDLRFCSSGAFRVEAELTSHSLIVRIRGTMPASDFSQPQEVFLPVQLNDCYSCGNAACARYPSIIPSPRKERIKTIIVDEYWPEYQHYLKGVITKDDQVILPFNHEDTIAIPRFSWELGQKTSTQYRVAALKRSIRVRILAKTDGNKTQTLLDSDEEIVRSIRKQILPESEHIIIAQNLLPFAQKYGLLGGRTYDVLMTRLPMELLHKRLDELHGRYPESTTASDFRADAKLIEYETTALTRSRYIITPHREIAVIFNNKTILLDWKPPNPKGILAQEEIVFPVSPLARKGVFEVRRLIRELGLRVRIGGMVCESGDFWNDTEVYHCSGNILEHAKVVVYPAVLESQPRILLQALAEGIPVIATEACGLAPHPSLTVVPTGDYLALRNAMLHYL